MSETEGPPQEPQPKTPLESVPVSEYEAARSFLSTFSEKPFTNVTTKNSLEDHIAGVGKALDAVIRTRGDVKKADDSEAPIQTRRILDKRLLGKDEHEAKRLQGLIENDGVNIKVTDLQDEEKIHYYIDIPYSRELTAKGIDFEAGEFSPSTDGEPIEVVHVPAEKPDDLEIQQGYARVLQKAVSDVLQIAYPSTSLEGIEDQFK